MIQEHPNYKHYLFVPNDMLPKYENNILLKGHKSRILSFADFLSGSICGDFIHVVCTDIMKQYPFDESLRIYEGVFFMRFYKEAKRILFTKKIVAIRERSRADSVTREVFRTSPQVVERVIKAAKLHIKWFKNDYEQLGLQISLYRHYQTLVDNFLLLGCYSDCQQYINLLALNEKKLSFCHSVIYKIRIGWFYRILLKFYLIVKYDILKKRLKI